MRDYRTLLREASGKHPSGVSLRAGGWEIVGVFGGECVRYNALVRKHRALWREVRALLREYRALWREYKAVWREYRALFRESMALLGWFLLSVGLF